MRVNVADGPSPWRLNAVLFEMFEHVLGAIEKLVESAAPDAGSLDDPRHRGWPLRQHFSGGQQQALAVLRIAF